MKSRCGSSRLGNGGSSAAQRTDAAKLQQPLSTSKLIYDDKADAKTEINQALAAAAKGHKRVLLIFGANWCYDCHVLDLAFQRPELASVLKQNYEVVHVDVGEYTRNMDLGQQYQVPLKKACPRSPCSIAMANFSTASRLASLKKRARWRLKTYWRF